ncbi:MAG: thermonuclease family protein [Planctomycetes bacterium]|nr:thermonuclease family protein [Planctomycetota bacterium]
MQNERRLLSRALTTTAFLAAITLPLAWSSSGPLDGVAQATAPAAVKKIVPTELYDVEKVVDGDTIHIMRHGKIEKLRLLCVDTEEKIGSGTSAAGTKPPTVFGEECALWAQSFFAGLAKDGAKPQVGLHFPGEKEERDFYGRLLCYVILPDGTDYQLMLIEMGKSPYFSKYGWSAFHHAEYLAAQNAARKAQRGIWDPKTNAAKTPGVPSAQRPYDRLLPWWDARADALTAIAAACRVPGAKVCDTDNPAALAEAAKSGEVFDCYGELAKISEGADGAMVVHFRASKRDQAFVVYIPKEKRDAFKELDLPGATEEFRQNYLWFKTRITADPKGYFKATSEDPAPWKRAGPEPKLP